MPLVSNINFTNKSYVVLFSDQFSWLHSKHHFCEFTQKPCPFLSARFARINRVIKIAVKNNFEPTDRPQKNCRETPRPVHPCLSKGGRDCHRDKSRNRSTWGERCAGLYLEREVKTYNFVDGEWSPRRVKTVPIVEISHKKKPHTEHLFLQDLLLPLLPERMRTLIRLYKSDRKHEIIIL